MAALGRSFFGRFFGRTIGEGAAFAIGTATAPALRPALQELSNATWQLHPVRPPDVGTLALGVAQGQVDPDVAADWAAQTGFGADQFKALVEIANTGPGVATAFDFWRRGIITEAGFRRAAKRNGIEPEWIDDLVKTKDVRLDPAVIANAVQQGFVPGDGILPPPPGGSLPYTIPFEEVPIPPETEWAAFGIDPDRGKVLAQLSGLPPGPMELLEMWRRGIITEASVDHGIREGHLKTKWTTALKALRHAILTGTQVANLRLRGWIKDPEMYVLGEKAGYDKPTMDHMLLGQGRPVTFRQVFIGLRRGGVYDGPTGAIAPPFLKSLQESDIRPEWYNLAWSQRHTLPSAFVLRALTSSGDLTAIESENLLLDIGWPEALAKAVAARWALGKAAGAKEATKTDLLTEYEGLYITEADVLAALTTLGYDAAQAQIEIHLADARRVAKARSQAVEAIHKSYVKHKIQWAEAATLLSAVPVPEPGLDLIHVQWDIELSAERASLTVAQIVRAYKRSVITRADALAELEERGYSAADAATLLDSSEPAPPQAPLP